MTLPSVKTPAQVQVFVDALGVDLAIQFLLRFGGREVSMPSRRVNRQGEVGQILGPQKSAALIKHVDRIPKRIPKASKWIGQVWLSRGMGTSEIARKLRVTDVTVRNWKSELAGALPPTPHRTNRLGPEQMDLFD